MERSARGEKKYVERSDYDMTKGLIGGWGEGKVCDEVERRGIVGNDENYDKERVMGISKTVVGRVDWRI